MVFSNKFKQDVQKLFKNDEIIKYLLDTNNYNIGYVLKGKLTALEPLDIKDIPSDEQEKEKLFSKIMELKLVVSQFVEEIIRSFNTSNVSPLINTERYKLYLEVEKIDISKLEKFDISKGTNSFLITHIKALQIFRDLIFDEIKQIIHFKNNPKGEQALKK